MSGVNSCCKYLMFFFNLCIFIGGCAMVGIGIWATQSTKSFQDMVTNDPGVISAVYFIIGAGGFLVVVGFFGCCGAIKENRCMLGIFFVMILVIFIFEVAGGILLFVKLPETEQIIKESMAQYGKDKTVTDAWDVVQTEMKCCGFDGAQDWIKYGHTFPSCKNPLNYGCKYVFERYFTIIGGIAIGILFVEVLAMIFSCCIFRQAGKDDRGY